VAHAVLTFAQTTSAVNGTNKGSSSSTKSYDWKGDKRIRWPGRDGGTWEGGAPAPPSAFLGSPMAMILSHFW